MDHRDTASRDGHDDDVFDVTPRDPKRSRPNTRNPDSDHQFNVNPDLDPTPKTKRPEPPPPTSRASSIASSSLASYASDLSLGSGLGTPTKKRRRQSSPRKQAVLMAMEKAVEYVSFDGDADLPGALDDLVSRIEDLARGNGIISHTEKRGASRRFRWIKETSFAPPPSSGQAQSTRDELGPTPALEMVNKIWTDADDCQSFQHFEIQWNCAVHFKMLEVALGHFRRLGFCICTGVQIHSNYTRGAKVSHHNKKVDFCIFVNEHSPELTRAALTSPFQSVNQTEYPALLERPIALSIETKVTGQDWAEAVNQISVWLLAQWDALDDLVLRTRRFRGGGAASPHVDSENIKEPRPSAAAASGLVFLPGIVVQGHDWYFVAMTRSAAGKTRLYSRVLCGSTQKTEGVYQVIAVLQLLGSLSAIPWSVEAKVHATPGWTRTHRVSPAEYHRDALLGANYGEHGAADEQLHIGLIQTSDFCNPQAEVQHGA
ncbi:hypothetical protein QIS74_04760 [Colletotrichum tabaci]|uniref:PD-(D/E)XK nuclease-like domain-containing protein n=1 Tax=Colletotrichum tabaci TaxID=1209068 RepID=A0AAV9TLD0_9PEZI